MEWRTISGYPDYRISDEGQVYSMKRNRLLTITDHGDGYKTVALCKGGKVKHPLLHRLVFETFIGAIPSGCEVNHKDEDKGNNRLDNLEVITHWQNSIYGTRSQRISQSNKKWRKSKGRAVWQYTSDGVFVRKWETMAEAHDNGFHKSGMKFWNRISELTMTKNSGTLMRAFLSWTLTKMETCPSMSKRMEQFLRIHSSKVFYRQTDTMKYAHMRWTMIRPLSR